MYNLRFGVRMRRISALLIVLFTAFAAQAQQTGTVSGRVTDISGEAIPGVNIKVLGMPRLGTSTNEDGNYKLNLPAGQEFSLVFTNLSFESDTQKVTVQPGETKQLNNSLTIGLKSIPEVNIKEKADPDGEIELSTTTVGVVPNPSGSFEGVLKFQGLGVAMTNELSSTYSVRGGSFDENLVYVNGFEIMRPFLIRSGQQEGLSFINGNMVSSATFSSGGFQPKYGDKLSSVLDVEYKRPKQGAVAGSLELGLLGGSFHLEGTDKQNKFTYLVGVRQKSSQYLLKGLETEGQYSPAFTDVQSFFTYKINKKVDLEWITNFAMNRFVFKPVSRETTFGVVNNVMRLTVYFDGKEEDSYRTFMTGFGVNQKINRRLGFKWLTSVYRSVETEAYDILGEYWLDEVETDFSNSNFGQTRFSLGVGGLHEYTRNDLETTVSTAGYKGYYINGEHTMRWGLNYQSEILQDRLNEWERLDSAGYAIPYGDDNEVELGYVLKSKIKLQSNRINGYVQDTWTIDADKGLSLTYGARITWWDINKEWVVSPRVQFAYEPKKSKSDIVLRVAAGLYNQPPFYREMRNLDGKVNTELKAQKSLHAIAGIDVNFNVWNRPFKFITEIYYKYLYDIVPFEYDNVLIRYFGENKAKGYAAGIDLRLHGELVEGAESWISMSIMSTQEDIAGDRFFRYFDATGAQVPSTSQNIARMDTVYPGNIPRPTDQRVRFNLFFQDYLPKLKTFKAHLNLVFATGLPFGPPDRERYRDVLRTPFYRRVDIGFSALLFDIERKKEKARGVMKHMESIWATLEVYNLLGVDNVVSYVWVKDVSNTTYAVPNYLTGRRVNFRIIFKF